MKALGYIVINATFGETLSLLPKDNDIWKNVPKGGILLHESRDTTAFATRARANAAIKRTRAYMIKREAREGKPSRLAEDELCVRKVLPA